MAKSRRKKGDDSPENLKALEDCENDEQSRRGALEDEEAYERERAEAEAENPHSWEYQERERKYQMEKKSEEVIDAIFHSLNTLGSEKETIQSLVDATKRQHRTLQQAFMRFVVALLKDMDERYKSGQYDLRNEASVKLAREIVEKVPYERLFLPLV